MSPLSPCRRPRPRTCWEVAVRRAAQARERQRQRRRRGRGGTPTASAVVRDLLAGLEGVVLIALAITMATAVMDMLAALLRQPAQQPVTSPPSRRPAPVQRPASVHGHAGFEDAHPGETLAAYQARLRPKAAQRYRSSAGTQAVYLHRLLAGRARPSDRLSPGLAEAVAGLDPAARQELALVPPERLVRRLQAIASGQYPAAVEPPPDGGPAAGPEDDVGPEGA